MKPEPITLEFVEWIEAESALAKASGILDVVSKAINADKGTEDAAPYCDSLWAASDSLDRLKTLLKLDREGTP
jgi:hypothetical protein